jgi:divalent metal cation (Fe/Co/Zn/Cd) transporter
MKYVFGILVAAAVIWAGWQILQPEITNLFFQDELHDSAAQPAFRTGMAAPLSDDELRLAVIRRAERHDIVLDPKQITIRRSGSGENVTTYIEVNYSVPVNLIVYSFQLHFSPSSTGARF